MMMKAKPVRTSSKLWALPTPTHTPTLTPSIIIKRKNTQLSHLRGSRRGECEVSLHIWGFTDRRKRRLFFFFNASRSFRPRTKSNVFITHLWKCCWVIRELRMSSRADSLGPTRALMISLHLRWFQGRNRFRFIRLAVFLKALRWCFTPSQSRLPIPTAVSSLSSF